MVIAEIIFGVVLVISIVVWLLGGKYLRILHDRQHSNHQLESELTERLAKIESLENRVAILEQIVTDKRYNLHEEFRNLEKAS